MWFALSHSKTGTTRIVSIDSDSGILFVETTEANLEVAAVVKARIGPARPELIREVAAALGAIQKMEVNIVAAMRSLEPIEQSGVIVDLGICQAGAESNWFGLVLEKMPAEIAETLRRSAIEAENLTPHTHRSLVRALGVDSARAQKVRDDPRGIYTIIPISGDVLGSLPHLEAALQCPGFVSLTTDAEDQLLHQWLARSNPKLLGQTLFLQIDTHHVFQVHFVPLPKQT